MSNILIIKHGSLGDIVQISGAIQDIFESHKNDQIYLMTTKPYYELFKKNPYISEVILDKRLSKLNLIYLYTLMKSIKKYNFSKVYDLQNSSRTSFYKKYYFLKHQKIFGHLLKQLYLLGQQKVILIMMQCLIDLIIN